MLSAAGKGRVTAGEGLWHSVLSNGGFLEVIEQLAESTPSGAGGQAGGSNTSSAAAADDDLRTAVK